MSEIKQSLPAARLSGRDPGLPSLLGDAFCLDFANTVEDRTGSNSIDFLESYDVLIRWIWHVWLIDDHQRDALLRVGAHASDIANSVFIRAIRLREAISHIFAAIAAGNNPARADLDLLGTDYASTLAEGQLERHGDRFDWEWDFSNAERQPGRILGPIVQSALTLLTSNQLHRVKQCPGTDDCGWLFLDISKNGTRRWCSMEGCGSRAKMRRLYARRKRETDE